MIEQQTPKTPSDLSRSPEPKEFTPTASPTVPTPAENGSPTKLDKKIEQSTTTPIKPKK
jgi:hypothetical protein